MRTSSKAFVTVVLGLCLAAFASAVLAADQPAAADASYLQSFDKWKAELVDDLKQNWLPLAGLFWLKPGENKFGYRKSTRLNSSHANISYAVFCLIKKRRECL